MATIILFGFINYILADSSLHDNILGKICGTYPWTFRCPVNTQCGTYTDRLCLTDSKGPTITGIIFVVIVFLLIFLIIVKACIPCCSKRKDYDSLSTDPEYIPTSRTVVSTVVAATSRR